MKANHYKKISFIWVILLCLSLSVWGKGSQTSFYYSNLGAKELLPEQVICVADKYETNLTPHLKYVFIYDENNRVVKKEAYRWSQSAGLWECSFHLKFSYSNQAMTIEYARWNCDKDYYDTYTERAVYTLGDETFASYSYYKKDVSDNDWELVTNLAQIPSGTQWIGEQLLLAKLP